MPIGVKSYFNNELKKAYRNSCSYTPGLRVNFTTAVVLLILFVGTHQVFGIDPFEQFLTNHCVRCHGSNKEEGDIRFDQLSRNFKDGLDTQHWAEALDKLNSGEMPPDDEPQPTQDEISAFVLTLDARIKQGRATRMAARPAVSHYRLSRTEYQNTVYDLLGVRYDPAKPGELNEDTLWHGYERIGSRLSLSPSHVDRYYRAAKIVLDRAYSQTSGESRKVRKTAADLRYGGGQVQQEALDRFGINRPLRYLLFPGRVQTGLSPSWLGPTGPEHSGLYKLRLQLSGIRPPGGQPAHLSIGKQTSEETVEGIIEFDITAPEDKPQVYEFEVFLEMPTQLHLCVVATDVVDRRGGAAFRNALTSRDNYIFTHSSETVLLNPNAPQMFDDKGNGIFSTVILDWIEWEGPIVTDAERALRQNVIPPQDATKELIIKHLHDFAVRAWRRPVSKPDLANYLQTYEEELQVGESPESAFQIALQGILTSRNFIYLVEGAPESRGLLTDNELASRLSYFLWSSMPDGELSKLGNEQRLKGEILGQEIDRLLTHEKISRFVKDFSRQWLQLHRVGMFPPDKSLYPNYDDWLEASLRAEPVEYFREMLESNASLDEFIHSNWTMANARISEFYGLPEPKVDGFQRVLLRPEDHRGGLLTMGAILGLTSDGTRHRPVHRGVWLSETVFNNTPPSAPANVDPIEPVPPEGNKITVRQRIEAHAVNNSCAACHRHIDPLGLAFDQYDAIGQWRTHERVLTGIGPDPTVDSSGSLPDGRQFTNSDQFKQLLRDDRDKFATAFIEHLCTYGLRRVLTVDDQNDILTIVEEAKKHNYGLRDTIRAVALSDLMKKR